jgi:hypothetical protein
MYQYVTTPIDRPDALSVGASSTSATSIGNDGAGKVYVFFAQGTPGETIYVRWGSSSVGAATVAGDWPIQVGQALGPIQVRAGQTHIRAIATAASQTLKWLSSAT